MAHFINVVINNKKKKTSFKFTYTTCTFWS